MFFMPSYGLSSLTIDATAVTPRTTIRCMAMGKRQREMLPDPYFCGLSSIRDVFSVPTMLRSLPSWHAYSKNPRSVRRIG